MAVDLPMRLFLGMHVNEGGCWEWTGNRDPSGYGRINIRKCGQRMVHRASYEYFVGPIPEGLEIDHRCRNRACFNPYHLEAVSRRENVLRGNGTAGRNARKTHCKNGHPLSGENLQVYTYRGKDRRICRICKRVNDTARMRRWRAERKAAA